MTKYVLISLAAVLLYVMPNRAEACTTTTTTCTNSCVITTNSNGHIAIQDCCGGRVHTVVRREQGC